MISLNELKNILEKEYYKSDLKVFDLGERKIEQLHVDIIFSDSPEIPDLSMIIMYLPDVEKELNNSSILQFFMGIALNNETSVNKVELINEINKSIPLGHFGFDKENKTLYIKYSHLIRPDETSNSFKSNLINIINSMNYFLKSNFNRFL